MCRACCAGPMNRRRHGCISSTSTLCAIERVQLREGVLLVEQSVKRAGYRCCRATWRALTNLRSGERTLGDVPDTTMAHCSRAPIRGMHAEKTAAQIGPCTSETNLARHLLLAIALRRWKRAVPPGSRIAISSVSVRSMLCSESFSYGSIPFGAVCGSDLSPPGSVNGQHAKSLQRDRRCALEVGVRHAN